MIHPSALSRAATAFRDHLKSHFAQQLPSISVGISIGDPGRTLEPAKSATEQSFLNLFFYRIEHSGYPADAGSADQQYVRMFCLLTPAATTETHEAGAESAGELELRLLGQVMGVLQEAPLLTVAVNGDPVAHLEIVPHSLSLDDLNKVWATQPGVTYRTSVAYELALMPVPEKMTGQKPTPQVELVTYGVTPTMADRCLEFPQRAVRAMGAGVPIIEERGPTEGWLPHLCLLDDDDRPTHTMDLEPGVSRARPRLMATGPRGLSVEQRTWTVVVEYWREAHGWQRLDVDETLELRKGGLDTNVLYPQEGKTLTIPVEEPGQFLIQVQRRQGEPAERISSNAVLVIAPDGERR